jgi:hypothetical protein
MKKKKKNKPKLTWSFAVETGLQEGLIRINATTYNAAKQQVKRKGYKIIDP